LRGLARVQVADASDRGRLLRRTGARIGEGCIFLTTDLGTEPYLVSIGDHCWISTGILFITHDSATWAIGETRPTCGFGTISIGSWSLIGARAILLPDTHIGEHSVVGAGSVVRGTFPDRSVIAGVPGRVVSSIDDYAAKALEREIPITSWDRDDLRQELTRHLLPEDTTP
jgi:acetyltransferase-like isoleucine patch superfamily enzyme